jgi:hypothetical protein
VLIAALTIPDVLAVCAVLGAAVSMATLVHGWMRDRQDRARLERNTNAELAKANAEVIGEIREELDRLIGTVIGFAADNGYPAREGFMQEHERRLVRLEDKTRGS